MGHLRRLGWIGIWLGLLTSGAQGADGGALKCEILENGKSASGTVAIERDGKVVADGACGDKPVPAPPGDYVAVLSLDGALDAPQQRRAIEIQPGKTTQATADFATATLKVVIERDGRRAAGMAIIRRAGKQIGTLGSGVSAHLSAGRYEVSARYHAQQKDFGEVQLKAGEDKVLQAQFE